MREVILGQAAGDHVGIRVKRRAHPQAADYWDGNWVDAEISIVVRPWRGTYDASLRTDEFAKFLGELESWTITAEERQRSLPWSLGSS